MLKIKPRATKRKYNKINILDITIYIKKREIGIPVSIYRKPTTVNWTITSSLCHATDYKLAAVWYLENLVTTYPISESEKKNRNGNNKNILHKNQYMTNLLIRKAKKKRNNKNTQIIKNSTYTKWLTFTYTGKQMKYITEEFENSRLKLLFSINSTIRN